MFIVNYKQKSERCGLVIKKNLIRVQKSLKGLEAVRGKLMVPGTVSQSFETLRLPAENICGHTIWSIAKFFAS